MNNAASSGDNARWVRATGASMLPFIPPGSRLKVISVENVDRLCVGDVVCFIDETGGGTAHRVVGFENSGGRKSFILKGDAAWQTEEVAADSIVFQILEIRWRWLHYRCESLVGKSVAQLALGDDASRRWVRGLLCRLWTGALFVVRTRRKIIPFRSKPQK
ncbi:MAG: S24/S26 family peptidase [Deltaproteobacteria bacterium]|nr:S24/S26 family peptidase [Deltaproteobacteria bacterium]